MKRTDLKQAVCYRRSWPRAKCDLMNERITENIGYRAEPAASK